MREWRERGISLRQTLYKKTDKDGMKEKARRKCSLKNGRNFVGKFVVCKREA